METVINQIKHLASTADEIERRKLVDGLRDLTCSLEDSDAALQRIIHTHLQISATVIGCDLKIFDLLAANESPMTLEQLQSSNGAAPTLLGRLLRYLASMGMIKEVGKDKFTTSSITKTLAMPGNQAGVKHQFYTCGPLFQELPNFLAKTKYQDITDVTDSVFQAAFNTPLPAYLWFTHNPQNATWFNTFMQHQILGEGTWLDVYPVEQETANLDATRAVFVDVGGNIGHQCAAFKAKFPNLPGSVILQDLPNPISQALPTPGVENMVYDAFEPQPVQGAKYYYLRAVLHNFPDDKCRLILQNIRQAMSEDSAILLDEMIPPDTNVNWQVTQIDLAMMSALAAIERTKSQWESLLASAQLRLANVYTYTPSVYRSVMTVVRQ